MGAEISERPSPPLTKREGELYRFLMKGLSDKEIAAELGISPRTVRFHVSGILRKRHAANRVQLIPWGRNSNNGAGIEA